MHIQYIVYVIILLYGYLRMVLDKAKIDPILRILIYSALSDTTVEEIKRKHSDIQWNAYERLIKHQTKIGWTQIKKGHFCREWNKLQARYHKRMNHNKNSQPKR